MRQNKKQTGFRWVRESGFTLITAIFLLVVVALLSGYILSLRGVQQSTLVYGVQGARGIQAARAGLEWGINRSLTANACPTTGLNFVVPDAALNAFTVTVSCSVSSHTEGAVTINVFQLTSTAIAGTYGTLDYVSRRLQATISQQPP